MQNRYQSYSKPFGCIDFGSMLQMWHYCTALIEESQKVKNTQTHKISQIIFNNVKNGNDVKK